jgi:hypothetical protein
MDQFQACTNKQTIEVQLVVKGGVAMEDVLVEQKKIQLMEQTTFISIEIHEHMQHVPQTIDLTKYMIVQSAFNL